MFDEQEYRTVFSKVTAPDECRRNVFVLNEEAQVKSASFRISKICAVALMISLLVLTACSSKTVQSWFVQYFLAGGKTQLSEEQMDFIRQRERQIQQSQTQDGYTVTLESYFADSMSAWFKLKIECPEGVQFCDSPWGTLPKSIGLIRKRDSVDLGGGSFQTLPDEEPFDNVGYIVFLFEQQSAFDATSLLDHNAYTLQIRDLWNIYLDNDDIVYEDVAAGTWEFDIDFRGMKDYSMEIIKEPVEYLVIADDNLEIPKEVPVLLTSFTLYPMRAVMWFEYLDEETYGTPDDFYPCTVVMRDGNRQVLNTMSVMCGLTEFRSPVPLILGEVDHILLPDGTKLTVPE